MSRLKCIFFISLFLSFQFFAKAQDQKLIDSLENVVRSSPADTNMVTVLLQLNVNYRSFNPDSAMSKCKQAMRISETYKFSKGLAKTYLSMSILFRQKGEHATAIDLQLKALKYFEELGQKNNIAKVYGNMGITYWQKGDLDQALKFYEKALEIDLQINNKPGISAGYNNIGGIFMQRKNSQKALEFFLKSVKLDEEEKNLFGLSNTYGNIGDIYFNLGKYDESIGYHLKSIDLCKKVGNKNALAVAYINIGAAYAKKKNFAEAMINFQKGITIAKEIDYKEAVKNTYKLYSETYAEMGEFKPALEYFKKYSDLHDTLISEEGNKQVTEMQTKYETEKKDKENKLLQKENELSAETIKQQKITSYFIISGLIVALLFGFFIFRSFRQKQKANIIITRQKEEVERQKTIVEEQKHEVEHKKEIIEEKNKEILDSIHYAKRIQRAVITSDAYISKYAKNNFILYKPKDIVSGDFYWALEFKKNFYLAIADCTGHGVPGAFMSLLNIAILNEAIIEKKITSPDLILNEARKDIIRSLNPEGSEESQDGMDCILGCFDFAAKTLRYAAANNSFYIVRDKKLITCAADKMPVGRSPKENEAFTLRTVELSEGDIVYCLTDGYPDQFGGPQGKKFKYKQLEEVFLSIHHLPMEEQKNILDQRLSEWKGNLEQVDDILLIGIKI